MKTTVLAFGTFDYVHAGHEYFLKKAAELGTELFVVVARDRTAKSIRNYAPDHPEKQRLKAINALPYVTKALLGNHQDKYQVIRKIKPQIIALGYDQMVFTQQLHKILIELKLNTKIIRLEAYHPEIHKSSLIRRSLKSQPPLELPLIPHLES
ncbi:MAG: glycerol-3-phosphate cytidylyltransferase, FAD synthetase [Candidatus Peregrinibacteria bacterium GW2011_GWE2_39_6]|nr:MAG: glycerol-3-phosphate cytidylyltransferase, FAD synthetase [Candidatus Peregrinibacteria bacterium GW2011_GWF2_39_17]KKR25961.1 MAG: glycerol-3-phosphate cytidylyltransferase, FAD synthetase [Candidatus Peregrinibacteria bacterium GW2011_GWE2_39_6]HCW32460.1 FAD synthase [Candidatus Peregrinibacteria bacterium]